MCCAVAYIGLSAAQFIVSVITDPEVRVDTSTIEATANYFPNSARAQARVASRLIESKVDITADHDRTVERAGYYAARAVKLAPKNYEFRLLLAAARELGGNSTEAESELRTALNLAPHLVTVHWRLANLLLREEKLDRAISEFRLAIEANPELLMPTLNLLWQGSDGNIEALNSVVGSDPRSKLMLAQFLILQGKFETAVKIAGGIDHSSILNLPESGRLLDSLISSSQIDHASKLWRDYFDAGEKQLIWNESFETPIRANLAQFDWNLSQSKYARIGITNMSARTGRRSLTISYQGIDTTILDSEIQQLVNVRPGARYKLTCYVKAEKLVTPDGPKIVVTTQDSTTSIASSAGLGQGSYDWQLLTMDFVAPSNARALIIAIKQRPQYSYVDPSQGTLWFDDFVLVEQ
jgi:tetratricopeptide (TPR) repeat protein